MSKKLDSLKTREEKLAARRKWRAANKELINKKNKIWRMAHRDTIRNQQLKTSYGITLEQYNAMISAQQHLCACCQKPLGKVTRSLHVDHCHESGRIRGILHRHCNAVIGFAQEDRNILKGAIEYLTKFNNVTMKSVWCSCH